MGKYKKYLAILLLTVLTLGCVKVAGAAEFEENIINTDSESGYEDIYTGGLIPMDVASDDVTAGYDELMDVRLDGDTAEDIIGIEKANNICLFSADRVLDSSDIMSDGSESDRLSFSSEIDINSIRRYNSRESGLVTAVKNQGIYGSCWAHAVMSQAETSAIIQGLAGSDIDLSEFHLGHFAYSETDNKYGKVYPTVSYGSKVVAKLSAGGNDYYAISELMNWHGIALESDYPYSLAGANKTYDKDKSDAHNYLVSNFYLIPTKESDKEDVKKVIKNCIYKFGSVGWSYYSTSGYYYNGTDSKGQRYTSYSTISTNSASNTTNHAITVVGWDDDFPIENFPESRRPINPGAWIIKNSYGSSANTEGYFYVSYEEPTIGSGNPASVIIVKNDTSAYDNNYFNSNGITNNYRVTTFTEKYNKVANVYAADGDDKYEKITAVSFLANTAENDYSIQLYRNPAIDSRGIVYNPQSGTALLKKPLTGRTSYAGLTTVEIPEDVYVRHGDDVAVVLTMSSGTELMHDTTYATRTDVSFKISQPAIQGKSFALNNNGVFYDVNTGKSDGNGKYFRLNIITDNVSELDQDIVDPENPDNPDNPENPDNPGDGDESQDELVNPVVHKANTWEYLNGKKYYYNSKCKTLNGWNSIKGKDGITRKYYFNDDGSVAEGIYKDKNGKSYYLTDEITDLTRQEYKLIRSLVRTEDLISDPYSENYNPELYIKIVNHGALQKGEITAGTNGDKHYFSDSKGVLCSGWQRVIDDKGTKTKLDDTITWKFYSSEEYGFLEYDNYDEFIASGPGALDKTEYPHWVKLKQKGHLEDDYFCFKNSKTLCKGYNTIGVGLDNNPVKGRYYFDKVSGVMARGFTKIGNNMVYFGPLSGRYSKETSAHLPLTADENGKVYCYSPKGKIQTGWQNIGFMHEEINKETGFIKSTTVKGKYYFEPSKESSEYGEMYVGVKTIKGKTYEFSSENNLLTADINGKRGMLIGKVSSGK